MHSKECFVISIALVIYNPQEHINTLLLPELIYWAAGESANVKPVSSAAGSGYIDY